MLFRNCEEEEEEEEKEEKEEDEDTKVFTVQSPHVTLECHSLTMITLSENSMERKHSTNNRSKKYNLDEPARDVRINDEAAYVTPWDRRLSRTVYFKRDPKNSSCSLLTDEQKEYLLRPLSDEYECTSEYLSLANSWNFPIFKFNDSTEHCLSLVRHL